MADPTSEAPAAAQNVPPSGKQQADGISEQQDIALLSQQLRERIENVLSNHRKTTV